MDPNFQAYLVASAMLQERLLMLANEGEPPTLSDMLLVVRMNNAIIRGEG